MTKYIYLGERNHTLCRWHELHTVDSRKKQKKPARKCAMQSEELKDNQWKNICFIHKMNRRYIYRVLNYAFHSHLKCERG